MTDKPKKVGMNSMKDKLGIPDDPQDILMQQDERVPEIEEASQKMNEQHQGFEFGKNQAKDNT